MVDKLLLPIDIKYKMLYVKDIDNTYVKDINSKDNTFSKNYNKDEGISFCIVIPFEYEEDFKRAINNIEKKKLYFCDTLILNTKEFEELKKKSKKLFILRKLKGK